LPECPIEAAKQGKEPKAPCYFDGRRVIPISWKPWQNSQPIEEICKAWFQNSKTGIGTLGGWNGKHWLGWIDFDQKDFASSQECDRSIAEWLDKYPLMKDAPMFRTPSGGYRFLVAFNQEPENFKANSGFSLKADGSHHVGELLSKNGGHTLLPPTVGVSGEAYQWVQWSEYPPAVNQPEDVGLYPVQKKTETKPQTTRVNNWAGDTTLTNLLRGEIYSRFSLEQAFNWHGHDFKQNGSKLKGNCPWHDSKSGTAFYVEIKDGSPVWCCPACNIGGSVIEYRHRLAGGNGSPRGSEFVALVKELASEVGVSMSENTTFSCQEKQGDRSKQNGSVTGDSRLDGDSQNTDTLSIAATVTTVTGILNSGFPDWVEFNKLEAVRVISELSNKQAFHALVSGIKSQIDEVQPEDEVRLQSLINWHSTELDFQRALPSMAEDILHDASVLNVDPIGIWQYLFTTVLSLTGKRVNLVLDSHEIPAIAWTGILGESGAGKTRVEKLVTSPLKQLQKLARERFTAEVAQWEETVANWKEGDGRKPPKPVERKYLFDVATIQAVMRRQSEQGMNGSLWVRDELIGIFQSFGQFNKGENEALSCLLAAWDGGSTQVDRVNQEDSYIIDSSRLSITGGIQPGVFKKIFKDPNDSQGLQARFLFAAMKPRKPKRVKGFCYLSEKLPPMYQWLDNLPEGEIKLSTAADQYYDKLYEQIGEQAMNTAMPAIRAWMFKLPGQLLRIALALHLIECYHDPNRPMWTLQKDTLERAVLFAQYYRSTFHIIQTTAVDTDDISAILLQIWDKALTRHPEGISTRDAYREIKAIQYRAKDAGRSVSAYTADLFGKLQQMGKGRVVKNGRLIKFVANLTPPPISPDDIDGVKPESRPLGDRVTVAETLDISTSEVSPESEVSPVTLPKNVVADAQQNEVSEEVEEATPLEQTDAILAEESEEAIAQEYRGLVTRRHEDESEAEELSKNVEPPQTIAAKLAGENSPTQAMAEEKPIRVGSRVRYIGKASKRCGMVGKVRKIEDGIATVWLDYDKSLSKDLQELTSSLNQLELIE
jgi:hypothetical protein